MLIIQQGGIGTIYIYDYNFLVFGYDGNTCFDVQIFGKSACERDYVFETKTNQESPFSNGAKECDQSSETPIDSVQKASKDDPDQCIPTFKPNGLKQTKREVIELKSEPLSRTTSSSSRRPATEEEKAKGASKDDQGMNVKNTRIS
ncbi:hypothetical protein NE237_023221 [Protea cynaroides]|uniref:Uncharacterized protein n=1 Tax=Protea cynaroides TaxID=273540 RepID=A0A9Q0HFV4_9MAGN|nr:hypothetical protein NE237_023221 [Protea cynaroides]